MNFIAASKYAYSGSGAVEDDKLPESGDRIHVLPRCIFIHLYVTRYSGYARPVS